MSGACLNSGSDKRGSCGVGSAVACLPYHEIHKFQVTLTRIQVGLFVLASEPFALCSPLAVCLHNISPVCAINLFICMRLLLLVRPFCIRCFFFFFFGFPLAKHISLQPGECHIPKPKAVSWSAARLRQSPLDRHPVPFRSVPFCSVLRLLRLKVVKLCGLINFVGCCCGTCFARFLPTRRRRHPLNLRCCCPAAIAYCCCCCCYYYCFCCCYSYGKHRTSCALAHLVAPAARLCPAPFNLLHTQRMPQAFTFLKWHSLAFTCLFGISLKMIRSCFVFSWVLWAVLLLCGPLP